MNMYDIRRIDLNRVLDNEFIKFLRIEIPERKGYSPVHFGRVRYTFNEEYEEQENGLPMDLGKGIFTATLKDEELNGIKREELEQTLRKAAVEIVNIVREELDPPSILKTILKVYPYLVYDEQHSEPPDILRCRVVNSESLRQTSDIFEIAQRLKYATGVDYKVGSYGGSSKEGDNLDKAWTSFSLRKFNFEEKAQENYSKL